MKLISLILFTILLLVNDLSAQHHEHIDYATKYHPLIPKNDGTLDKEQVVKLLTIMKEAHQYHIPDRDPKNSTFYYYQQARRFTISKNEDSANYYFSNINPYHIKSIIDQTNITLDTLLSKFFLSNQTKTITRDKILNTSLTSAYDSFRQFYLNIVNTKREMDTANIQARPYLEQYLKFKDSAQAAYLRAYIKRNGWPDLAHGSWFAAKIAARDIEHFYFYLPHLIKAVNKHQVPVFLAKKIENNAPYYYSLKYITEGYKRKYKCFDVSTFRHMYRKHFLTDADLSKEIFGRIAADCNILDFFFVLYTKDLKKEFKMRKSYSGATATFDIWKKIEQSCPDLHSFYNQRYGETIPMPHHFHLPNLIYTTDREFFCIVYR